MTLKLQHHSGKEINCVSCLKKKYSLFDGLSNEELTILENNRTACSYKKGEPIYKKGIHPYGLICLNKGKAKIVVEGAKNKEQVVALKKPVDFLGFTELLAKEPYDTSCIALEDCSVCIIDKADFYEVLIGNPEFHLKVTRQLAIELKTASQNLVLLTQKNLRARLADALLKIYHIYGVKSDNCTLNASLKRADIADMANMTTANAIRTISDFTKEGLIKVKGKAIIIPDPQRLYSESID